MENNENHKKLSDILHDFLGDAFTLDGKEGGLNMEKMREVIKKRKTNHEHFAHGSYWSG